MQLAGLTGTYKSNPRMARKKLREKLNKMQEAGSISKWEKTEDGYILMHYRKQGKKTKKTTKNNIST